MSVDRQVAEHYRRPELEEALLDALARTGVNVEALTAADLAPVDEFHVGGLQATEDLAAQLPLDGSARVLDVGCGIGGPARYLAASFGCHVTGVDLTEDFIEVARSLTRRVGLDDLVDFAHASATALPFEAASFDGAILLHVGMNIPDKDELFRELARVVRPGGFLGAYEIMRGADGELDYPLPWAGTPATSFLETPARYAELVHAAGFGVVSTRDRREFGIQFFAQLRARAEAGGGAPALGPQLIMGADGPVKVANLVRAMEQRLVAPTELVATRTAGAQD